jgi:hypothetical protein
MLSASRATTVDWSRIYNFLQELLIKKEAEISLAHV